MFARTDVVGATPAAGVTRRVKRIGVKSRLAETSNVYVIGESLVVTAGVATSSMFCEPPFGSSRSSAPLAGETGREPAIETGAGRVGPPPHAIEISVRQATTTRAPPVPRPLGCRQD